MNKKYILLILFICLAFTACTKVDNKSKNTYKEDAQMIKEVYEETEETELLLGLWVTPVAILTKTPEDANMRYAEIKESGIVMAYTHHHETHDMKQLKRALDAAELNGIKMIVSLIPNDNKKSMKIVQETKDHVAVYGYNLVDEPSASTFTNIAELRDSIKAVVSEDKIIMCNLFPNYAPDSALGTNQTENSVYYNYLDTYMEIAKPDVLSFDHYPFMASKDSDPGKISLMLKNLSDIRNIGEKYDVDTWGFAQNSSWLGTRIPNDDELRFVCNLHLIFGLKSYSYFLYCQPSDTEGVEGVFQGMLTYKGEKTEIYYRVQKQNKDLKAMKGVYLNYNHKGFITHNLSKDYVSSIESSLNLKTYKELKDINSKGQILVGCFEKEGKTGLYVMNFDYSQNNDATLNLNGSSNFKVWGPDGLEQMNKSSKISIKLKPGEGKFVELG